MEILESPLFRSTMRHSNPRSMNVAAPKLYSLGPSPDPVSSRPDRTANTLAAIEKFLALHLIVLGTLQLLAATFGDAVREQARCWLRTPSGAVPSDFVSRTALANLLLANIRVLAENPVIALIRRRQIAPEQLARKRRAA
jgi:hypothetical protein